MSVADSPQAPGLQRFRVRVRAVHVAVAVAAGLALVLAVLLVRPLFANHVSAPAAIHPRVPPSEFLYLDSRRVVAYLAQVEDGLTDSERRSISTLLTGGLEASVAGIGGSASKQMTTAVEQVVTPTDASRYNHLHDRLADRKWLHVLDARRLMDVGQRFPQLNLPEGEFVEVRHVLLTVPPLVTAYRYARQSGEADAKAFVKLVGPNPRVPLSFRTERQPLLLFVGRYGSLADEGSIFFGEVTVVGKLIRRVLPDHRIPYIDGESLSTYGTAQSAVPAGILQRLKKRRNTLLHDLKIDVTVDDLGAVILPIAIFK
jgi:hypothetical protein